MDALSIRAICARACSAGACRNNGDGVSSASTAGWGNRRISEEAVAAIGNGNQLMNIVIILLSVLNIPYADYKASASPVNYLLLPATISLAIPLYEKWDLLKENAAAIIAGISVGTLVSLGSALALALALGLTREQYATLLPKSVTTAISMDVAAELGGIAALTGAIVILTGIAGNLLAESVCKWFHITDPIAKGVGIGTSAHAVGTSKALQMGEVEGAMSGLSIAVAGVLTAVLCPFFVGLIH